MSSFDETKTANLFHHQLKSTFHDVDETIKVFSQFVKETKVNTNIFILMLAVREALSNAVQHGNKMDPSKHVDFDFLVDDTIISITVTDEGEGFEWQNVVNKQSAIPDRSSGCGLYDLLQFGFDIRYNDKGNSLYLTKQIDY